MKISMKNSKIQEFCVTVFHDEMYHYFSVRVERQFDLKWFFSASILFYSENIIL